MSGPTVTVVIVTYGSRETIDAALDSIRPGHETGLLECVVVDNASSDGTAEHVRTRHPWVRVEALTTNVGFGRGCNVGIEAARTPFVFLMNPDVELSADALGNLVEFLETRPRAGFVAPALIEGDYLQEAGGLPTPWSVVCRAAGRPRAYSGRRTIEPGGGDFPTDWLCGAAVLARTTALQQLGGFDPRFFLYFEETDLFRRAAEAGWEIWATGAAVGHHAGGASARVSARPLFRGAVAEHFFASRHFYLGKHHGRPAAAATAVASQALLAVRILARALLGRPREDLVLELRALRLRRPTSIVPGPGVRLGGGAGNAG